MILSTIAKWLKKNLPYWDILHLKGGIKFLRILNKKNKKENSNSSKSTGIAFTTSTANG